MVVNKDMIYLDKEDEEIAITLELTLLHEHFEDSPRWFFIRSEWNAYLVKKQWLQTRLRKLQGIV